MNWRDIPTLAALRGFEAAARAGSFSAAARELNVTHAAIAQHVRTVETQLNTPLMHREGRKMALTPAGTQLAADLGEGFRSIISGVTRISSNAEARPLQVTVTPNLAENWLMPRLGDFWEKHPNITLSLMPSNDVIDLRRDGFDMAIRFGNGNWPGVDSRFLISGDYVVVIAPSLLGDRQITSLVDLNDLPWLFVPHLPVYQRWATENGLDLDKCTVREVPTMSMAGAGARAGTGVTVMVRALAAADIATGALVALHDAPKPDTGYYIVTQKGVVAPKAAIFQKWLLRQAQD